MYKVVTPLYTRYWHTKKHWCKYIMSKCETEAAKRVDVTVVVAAVGPSKIL